MRNPTSLARDERGSVLLEFTVFVTMLLTLTGGLVEFSLALYQWNAASKAVQAGARLAAVSRPVATGLKNISGLGAEVNPGDPMPYFEIVCGSGSCSGSGGYDSAAMAKIVTGLDDSCGTVPAGQLPGMCDIFNRIQPQHVTITYTQTGMGFAGRPRGPVPTITIQLTGLTFNFHLLRFLPGFNSITLPTMRSTITGEDLCSEPNSTVCDPAP